MKRRNFLSAFPALAAATAIFRLAPNEPKTEAEPTHKPPEEKPEPGITWHTLSQWFEERKITYHTAGRPNCTATCNGCTRYQSFGFNTSAPWDSPEIAFADGEENNIAYVWAQDGEIHWCDEIWPHIAMTNIKILDTIFHDHLDGAEGNFDILFNTGVMYLCEEG